VAEFVWGVAIANIRRWKIIKNVKEGRKIMEYIVLTGSNKMELVLQVNEYLDSCWSLQGGVSVGITDVDEFFAQAMVRGQVI